MAHIPTRMTVRLLGGRHIYRKICRQTRQIQRTCSDTQLPMDLSTDIKKSREIFKILVRISKEYRWNLMPLPKKILFYVLSGIPSVNLQYKPTPPLRGSFFPSFSNFFSSLPSLLLSVSIFCIFHCIFIVLIVVFNILKGMILLSLSLYFFTFFCSNYDYFVVFFVLCVFRR